MTLDQLISRLMRARSEGASGRSRVCVLAADGSREPKDLTVVSVEARPGEPQEGDVPDIFLETDE